MSHLAFNLNNAMKEKHLLLALVRLCVGRPYLSYGSPSTYRWHYAPQVKPDDSHPHAAAEAPSFLLAVANSTSRQLEVSITAIGLGC
jgi:hypothetical protein